MKGRKGILESGVGEHGRSNHTMDNPEKPVTQDASNEEII
jgi:hypothetical protein